MARDSLTAPQRGFKGRRRPLCGVWGFPNTVGRVGHVALSVQPSTSMYAGGRTQDRVDPSAATHPPVAGARLAAAARRAWRHDAGLTLIEVIAAVALLGILATGLVAAMATGLRASLVVEDQTISATAVTSQIEDILSQTYVERTALTHPPVAGARLAAAARRAWRHDAGLTLIEVIAAVALLGILATGLVAAMATGLRASLVVEDQTISATAVTSQIEDILSQTYVEPAGYPEVNVPEGYSLSVDNLVVEPTVLESITVSISGADPLFDITTYKVNDDFVASPPTLVQAQRDYRWYQNIDELTPTTPLEAENTPSTVDTAGQVVRLRMSIEVTRVPLPATDEAFKLQFASAQEGPWTDVGDTTSFAVWRGFDNPTVPTGTALPLVLLSGSDVAQSYTEESPYPANPGAVAVDEWAEWDWVVQENGAATGTSYVFRVVKDDGTPLESYTRYPVLAVATP